MERQEAEQPLDELSGTLRPLVEAARSQSVPAAAMERALKKASRLPHRRRNRGIFMLVAACLLAAFGVGLWAMQQNQDGPWLAWNEDQSASPSFGYKIH